MVTPEMNEALSELRELIAYGREFPDLGESLSKFLYGGSPAFRTDVDRFPTEPAGDFKVQYQLSDGLRVLLFAGRARDIYSNNVPERV